MLAVGERLKNAHPERPDNNHQNYVMNRAFGKISNFIDLEQPS